MDVAPGIRQAYAVGFRRGVLRIIKEKRHPIFGIERKAIVWRILVAEI